MSAREPMAWPATRYRFAIRACIVNGSFAALAIAVAPSCGGGRQLDASGRARADEVGEQKSPLTPVPAQPCSGPDCSPPPPPPSSDGGLHVDADTDCIQSCIDQNSDALGVCVPDCKRAYPLPSQNAQYQTCRSQCEARIRAGIARACRSWRNCDGTCVDTATDSNNCGTCGDVCPPQLVCTSSSCGCPSGQSLCSLGDAEYCASLQIDVNNCGACGRTCSPGQRCSSGLCCAGRQVNCGGTCTTCPVGGVCSGTSCDCPSGQTNCGGVCTSLSSDSSNCGTCGNACTGGTTCLNGMCACPNGTTSCGGTCISLVSDSQNCGACGHVCRGGTTCQSGMCTCPNGTTNCGGTCTSLVSDSQNCGACGNVCRGGTTCQGGTCACPGGLTNCGGTCVSLQTDSKNCGACGAICNFCCAGTCGADCNNGTCCPDYATPTGPVHAGCCADPTKCGVVALGKTWCS